MVIGRWPARISWDYKRSVDRYFLINPQNIFMVLVLHVNLIVHMMDTMHTNIIYVTLSVVSRPQCINVLSLNINYFNSKNRSKEG